MEQNRPEEIIIHPHTIQKFMRYKKDYANLIALYTFYIYHAQLQKTNRPLATNEFVKRGLGWSLDKIKRIKRILKELKLIDVVRRGKYYYIYLPFIYTKKKVKEILNRYKEKIKSKSKRRERREEREYEREVYNYLVSGNIKKERAREIAEMVSLVEGIEELSKRVDMSSLARWLWHCEKFGVRYDIALLKSWIEKLSKYFFIDQVSIIDNATGKFLMDLEDLKGSIYTKYRKRSIKAEGFIFKNLYNVYIDHSNSKYIYLFENGRVGSYFDIWELFDEYGID